MLKPDTAKSAELQIVIWFLESGWEVFTPVSDLNGTDIVVREPLTRVLLAIQIKHKRRSSKNEGQLNNPWAGVEPPFDYLIFYQPSKARGLVVPKKSLRKKGKMFLFFAQDEEGYSTGNVRPLFADFGFELSKIPHEERPAAFVLRFAQIHQATMQMNKK